MKKTYKVLMYILLSLMIFLTYKSFICKSEYYYFNELTNNYLLSHLIGLLLFVILIFIICYIFNKIKLLKSSKIPIFIFTFMIIIQILFCYYLNNIPTVDSQKIYLGAEQIIEMGKISPRLFDGYFEMFTNNVFITVLASFVFKFFSLFGISNLLAGKIVTIISLDLSVLLLYKILNKTNNKEVGNIFLIINFFNPIMYIQSLWFYTTTLCIPFMIGLIYIFIKISECESKKMKYIYTSLFSFVMVVGFEIRVTTLISVVAIFIYIFLNKKDKKIFDFKSLILFFLITICLIFSINILKNKYMDNFNKEKSFPITYWLLVGLSEDGKVNGEDIYDTKYFSTNREKISGNLEEIKSRVNNYGVKGYLDLIDNKFEIVWCKGTSNWRVILDAKYPYSDLYGYINGAKNDGFLCLAQIYRIFIYLFTAISIYILSKQKEKNILSIFSLIILGAIVFYVFWEAKEEYNVQYILFFEVLASYSLFRISKSISKRMKNHFKKINIK